MTPAENLIIFMKNIVEKITHLVRLLMLVMPGAGRLMVVHTMEIVLNQVKKHIAVVSSQQQPLLQLQLRLQQPQLNILLADRTIKVNYIMEVAGTLGFQVKVVQKYVQTM